MATISKTAAQKATRKIVSSSCVPQLCFAPSRCITSTSSRLSHQAQPVSLSSQCLRLQARRGFSSTRASRFPEDPQKQTRSGVRIAVRAALFIGTGLALIGYFQYEKARLERKRIVEMSKGYGKPKVGGPFTLKDLEGKDVTEKDLLGKYSIIYFGFTHCPDICPDELDKLSAAIDILNANPTSAHSFRSLFVSVDPARDTPAVLKDYLAEFHPQIVGLTGSWQEIKDTCKAYRVYFSTPQDLKPGEEDYLVDHSIYFYVMDPEGDFVECIGRQDTPESAAAIILEHIKDWRKGGKTVDQTPLQYKNEAVQRTAQGRSSEVGGGSVVTKTNAPS